MRSPQSLASHEADRRKLAAQRGLTVVAVRKDTESGAIRTRPGFTAWLDDARKARADHLLVWAVDRITREGAAAVGLLLDAIEGASFPAFEWCPVVGTTAQSHRPAQSHS